MNFSKIGFGCYRIDNRVQEHTDALKKALTSGISVIDTSSNYSDGRSEILVGNLLGEILDYNNNHADGKINRNEIFLITKTGYMQGQNLRFAKKQKEIGKPFKEVVEFKETLWHCISPDFLEDQLSRQLLRLDQSREGGYIDAYLLHNPEYFLKDALKKNISREVAQNEYYSRIRKAFEFFEQKADEGKIRSYGISSNTFPSDSEDYAFTSLERIFEISQLISPKSRFKYIQLPFNLIESGALLNKNQSNNTKTVLNFAAEKGIKVIVNRPLNSIAGGTLIRLADFHYEEFNEEETVKDITLLELMEDDIINEKHPNLVFPEDEKENLESCFKFGKLLKEQYKKFGSIENFNDIIEYYFSPGINYLMDYIEMKSLDDNLKNSYLKYLKTLFKTLNGITNFYAGLSVKRNKYIHDVFDEATNGEFKDLSLSQKVLLLLISVEEVWCVLVGARKEKYVEDALGALKYPRIKNAKEIFEKVKK